MIRATADAILAALDPITSTVYDGKVPANPNLADGYVVLYSGQAAEASDRASGGASTADHKFSTTAIGISAAHVRLHSEWVRDALIDVRLAIPGRQTTPIEYLGSSGDPRIDEDIPAKPFYANIQWRFMSVPIPLP